MNKFNILINVATKDEIIPLLEQSGIKEVSNDHLFFEYKNIYVDIFITGIGPIFTTYNLTEIYNKNKYDLAINTGICGAFNRDLPLASAVNIVSDCFGDLGIGTPQGFSTLFDNGFLPTDTFPFVDSKLFAHKYYSEICSLRKVSGITVSNVSGEVNQILERKNKFNVDVETMEGAAFFYVSLLKNVKCVQIRTISNYVEPRNKQNWKFAQAVLNLSETLFSYIENINNQLQK